MLDTLELFAGIGGITYGLRGFAKPAAFVEWNDEAKNVLKRHKVPIFDDVTTFDATSFKDKVDMVSAGWPCTGFSTAGHGTGFSHEASGLFVEVVRVIKECQPNFVFLENSHVLAQTRFLKVVLSSLDELGYDARWMSCKSTCVGAIHERHRWFCLAVKRGFVPPTLTSQVKHKRFDWDSDEPAKQVPKNTEENKMMIRLAGNSVVPDQIRFVFKKLYSGFSSIVDTTSNDVEIIHWNPLLENNGFVENIHQVKKQRISNGFCIVGRIHEKHVVITHRNPINKTLYPNPLPDNHKVKDLKNVVTNNVTKRFWSTPCHTDFRRTSPVVLTKRLLTNLPAQVRFVEDSVPGWRLSGEWCLWLMGYHKNYIIDSEEKEIAS